MAFQKWEPQHLARFNSATSSAFLDFYEACVEDRISASSSATPHQTFAPSSFRCNRRSWFRIRGVTPDVPDRIDTTLDFAANIGTACHRIIQSDLKFALGDDWISVDKYLKDLNPDYEYNVVLSEDGLEYNIEIIRPPIRFACDGLIKRDDDYYLLEIKTADFASWSELTEPKPQHIDQVKCYATLLDIHNVLFLYQDRQYGGLKCYEVSISPQQMQEVRDRFEYVLDMVDKNIAPEALREGDSWCTPGMCKYYTKCREYGR